MRVLLPDRMLSPVRRWALRELKVHAGHVVVVAGCPAAWIVPVLRDLVADAGAVLVFESDERRARQATTRVDAGGWSNVAVVAARPNARDLPPRADRVLLDDGPALEDVERLIALLGPGGRIAAICRRGDRSRARIEARVTNVRRESFYGGTAYALWAQIP